MKREGSFNFLNSFFDDPINMCHESIVKLMYIKYRLIQKMILLIFHIFYTLENLFLKSLLQAI